MGDAYNEGVLYKVTIQRTIFINDSSATEEHTLMERAVMYYNNQAVEDLMISLEDVVAVQYCDEDLFYDTHR